jgi:hypothetical protein
MFILRRLEKSWAAQKFSVKIWRVKVLRNFESK